MSAVKSRVQLTDSDRKVICELARDNKDLSPEKLTALAAETLKKHELKRSTVTGILKYKEKWLNCSDSAANSKVKHRAPQHEKLEAALMEWFGQLRAKNALIIDSLVEKAKALAEKLHIQDFKASDGWLWRFKQRHNIKLQRPHGESGAADLEGIDIARTVVGKIITELGYKLEDVYNTDETGLYYRAKPSKTLAVGSVQGMKMQKDRITISADTRNSDDRERHRDNAAAAELSMLINSLDLGVDALTAEDFEQFPGEQQVKQDLTDDELVALVTDAPQAESAEDISDCELIEDVVTAPSLPEMRQHLKGFAAFMADNSHSSAKDELMLQKWQDRVAKMLISRANQRQQQRITSYFT